MKRSTVVWHGKKVAIAGLVFLFLQAVQGQEIRALKASFYDFPLDGPTIGGTKSYDFGNYRSGSCGSNNQDRYTYNMVQRTLLVDTLADGTIRKRPKKNLDLVIDCNSSKLDFWFVGDYAVNKSEQCRILYFTRAGSTPAGSPVWRYDQKIFFPLDDAPGATLCGNTCLANLYGDRQKSPDGKAHNYNWTMKINASFTYRGGEKFFFRGDDDLWVFINDKLALDLGGIHSPLQQGEMRVDEVATTLMLEKGKSYPVDIFFAERKGAGSTVFIETTMDLIPVELKALRLKDEEGVELVANRVIDRVSTFCADPSWEQPGGGGDCKNYLVPTSLGGSVEVEWFLDGKKISTTASECISLDPSDPAFSDGKAGVLKAVYTKEDGTVVTKEASLTGKPNILVDSVFLVGHGELEEIGIRFTGDPAHLSGTWSVAFSSDGFAGTIGPSDISVRRDGYTWYYKPKPGAIPAKQSYISPGARALFSKTDSALGAVNDSVPLIDRMTPVIVSAQIVSAAKGFALTITVSEEISPAKLAESHLTWKKPGGTTYNINLGSFTSSGRDSRDPTVYLITLPPLLDPLPQIGDSVSLVANNAFVKDKNGNMAVTSYVEMQGELTIRPTAVRLRGTGGLDTVVVDFDHSASNLPVGYQISFDFLGTRVIKESPNTVVSGSRLIYVLPAGTVSRYTTSVAGATQAVMLHPYVSRPADTLRVSVIDEMGPVIDGSASPNIAIPRSEGKVPQFTFRISEPTSKTIVLDDLVFVSQDGGEEYQLSPGDISSLVESSAQAYTITFTSSPGRIPLPGDSVFVASTAKDSDGNVSPRFPALIIGDSIASNFIVSAAYFDADADGAIDSVSMTFNGALFSAPVVLSVSNNGVTHLFDSGSDSVIFNAALDSAWAGLKLDGAGTRLWSDVTFVKNPRLTLAAQPLQGLRTESVFVTIGDSAAPVLTNAAYFPYQGERKDSLRHDTLVVSFTEPSVVVQGTTSPQDIPFRYLHNGVDVVLTLRYISGNGTSSMRFEVLSIGDDVVYPFDGDSLAIAIDNRVADIHGVVQRNPSNKPVRLRNVYPPIVITTRIAPNPFRPGKDQIPDKFVQQAPGLAGMRNGAVISVNPSTEAALQPGYRIEGTVSIYDGVGNVVVNKQALLHGANGHLYFVWDGQNQNHRIVAAGSYVAIVYVHDKVNGAQTSRLRIGVRR